MIALTPYPWGLLIVVALFVSSCGVAMFIGGRTHVEAGDLEHEDAPNADIRDFGAYKARRRRVQDAVDRHPAGGDGVA